MKQIYPDLWQTPLEYRFGTLKTHAYLLQHKTGQDLIYVAENPETHKAINKMGGLDHIYLSHNHEITTGLFKAADTLGTKVAGHSLMQPRFTDGQGLDVPIDVESSVSFPSGLEVIYTPGHTDNNVCYRYVSPHGKTYLFTGDTIYLDNGKWKTIVMQNDGGNAIELKDSLAKLRDVQVDVVITSVAMGEDRIVELGQSEWKDILDNLIADLN